MGRTERGRHGSSSPGTSPRRDRHPSPTAETLSIQPALALAGVGSSWGEGGGGGGGGAHNSSSSASAGPAVDEDGTASRRLVRRLSGSDLYRDARASVGEGGEVARSTSLGPQFMPLSSKAAAPHQRSPVLQPRKTTRVVKGGRGHTIVVHKAGGPRSGGGKTHSRR